MNTYPSVRSALLLGIAMAALALPAAARAQDMADAPIEEEAEAAPPADDEEGVTNADFGNEIVVTATKREQTLQNVPVAVSVTTAEAIERQAPAVCARTADGRVIRLMTEDELARCRGSVRDFRGRLLYRLAALGLSLGAGAGGAGGTNSRPPRPAT